MIIRCVDRLNLLFGNPDQEQDFLVGRYRCGSGQQKWQSKLEWVGLNVGDLILKFAC